MYKEKSYKIIIITPEWRNNYIHGRKTCVSRYNGGSIKDPLKPVEHHDNILSKGLGGT